MARKVKDVLQEIEQWDNHYEKLKTIHNKMENDHDVATYMKKTFGLTIDNVQDMKSSVCLQKAHLKDKLNQCEVDV